MQRKNYSHESFAGNIELSHPSSNARDALGPRSPILCVLIPGAEAMIAASFYRHILRIPGAAYLVMDAGMAGRKEPGPHAIVQSSTVMPVLVPEQGMPVEVNRVYLVTPGMSFYYSGEKLLFRTQITPPRSDGAVDHFLATVAAMAPDRHIVLLSQRSLDQFSGGLRVVQAEGGFVLAFTEEDAFHFHRPGRMAADLLLTPAETLSRLRLLFEGVGRKPASIEGRQEEAELARIYLQLLRHKGMDFARRRQPEILRRIHRRMLIHGVKTFKEYGRIVTEEAEELALFEELRISLAGFFLDATVEHALLNDVLPRILEEHQPATPLRVWIPCCCGGHEAYAMAIFLSEYLHEQKKELTVQIFATDLNKASSERSRAGVYDAAELAGLSTRRRKRYFTKSPAGYHVARQLREMCVFATQNLFKDPPFSHVDIILGLSAMRGLSPESMDSVLRTFHYALRPYGHLLCDYPDEGNGSSELFRRIRINPSVFIRQEKSGLNDPLYFPGATRMGEQEADTILLGTYVPPTLLIDEQLRIVRFYGNTGPYIRSPQDRPSLHLLRMVRDELVFEFDNLIKRSNKEEGTVVSSGIQIGTGANARQLSVEIAPLRVSGGRWKLVIIREMPGEIGYPAEDKNPGRTLAQKEQRIQSLEKEATELRSLLVAASEDATKIQQTLQIVNEEIMASNEELQSVNEQLQSVNQRLLSSNVELNTVNEDLSVRNRELLLSVEYAHAIVGSLRQPTVVLQDDLRIRLANAAFRALFGTSTGEVQGQSLYVVANNILDRDELRKALRQVLTRKSMSANLELRLDLGDRGDSILAIDIIRMPRVKNFRPRIILSLEDITERRATEKFKDEFIGIASHELKTPATSIQAYSQMLTEELLGEKNQQSADLAMKLSGQVSRLTRLTKDLLDVTRISQGQVNFKMERLDIVQLIAETVEELQVTTEIRLTMAEHPPLPLVKGDRDRLRQVLANLLSNAIKYAPDTPEIIIRTTAAAGMVEIAIQDFGSGISTENMHKIFDRYYRLDDDVAGGYPGVGLGLYIALEIVRRHGGDIKVNSEKNKGSVFTMSLPVD